MFESRELPATKNYKFLPPLCRAGPPRAVALGVCTPLDDRSLYYTGDCGPHMNWEDQNSQSCSLAAGLGMVSHTELELPKLE